MKRNALGALLALFYLSLIVAPAFAHHAITSEFDPSKSFTITGVLTRLEWTNPHSYFFVTVKEDGKDVEYMFEGYPPVALHRAGITKADWKIGETVTVTAVAPKDGSKKLGFARTIKYASDGHVLVFRNAGE
jgi:hypothetical protein